MDNILSLSKSMSFLPLSTVHSQLVISRERSSDKDSFNFAFEDRAIQFHCLCLVFSSNFLSIVRHCPFDRLPQSQSLSWFSIKKLLLTANLLDLEIAFQSQSSLMKSLSKLSSKTISALPDRRLKSTTSLNIFILSDSLD